MIEIGNIKDTEAKYILDIRGKNQIIKAKAVMPDDSKYVKELMKDHYISFSFKLDTFESFERGDYIDYLGQRFTLRSKVIPTIHNEFDYKYELKFEADEMFLLDAQMYYLRQDLKESAWSLTANAASFIKNAVDNANRYFNVTDWKVGTIEATEIKLINFDNDSVFDALTKIAETFDSEWYVTGKTIHLVNKLNLGAEVELKNELNIEKLSESGGSNDPVYTRIVAFGSTRNIPANYSPATSGEMVEAIYQKRLRIPKDKGSYIDLKPNLAPNEIVEGSLIFDNIYPKRIGGITTISEVERSDEEGKTFKAYIFTDSSLQFKEEYLLAGKELRLVFQSGKLNGLDFALKFNPNALPETHPDSQCFEIIRSADYGAFLPNDIIKPEIGDKYILHGFNIDLVSAQYIPEAEQELYNEAVKWLDNQLIDKSIYTFNTYIQYFHDNNYNFDIGQRIKLISPIFEGGFRSSRIMGFEKKLYNVYDASYTIGDNPAYNPFSELQKEIEELKFAGDTYQNTGVGSVYLIKTHDTTRPTEYNAYSAVASDDKFFNKKTGDTIQGDTLFQKDMQVQGVVFSDVFQNSTFTAGQFGSGFQIKRDANGQSYMEVDNIMVRREMIVNTLTIAEIKSVGGQILVSPANMYCNKVDVLSDRYRCYFDNDKGTITNQFAVNDQAICRKFNSHKIKYYWRLVIAVGANYIDLSKTDTNGVDIPAERDEIIQFGNRSNANRQSAIVISAYGNDAPSLKQYAGVNSYNLTGKEVTVISPAGNKFTGAFTISTNGTTAPIYKDRAKFVNGTTYYLNDRVSHLGSYWVCIVASTITKPSEGSSTWRKDTTGQGDIDKAANQIRTEYKADFEVLNNKIVLKVSQSDFDNLSGKVTDTEASIKVLSGNITSVVEKVDNLKIGTRNYLLETLAKTIESENRVNQCVNLFRIVNGSVRNAGLTNKELTFSYEYELITANPSGIVRFQGSSPYPALSPVTYLSGSNNKGKITHTFSVNEQNDTSSHFQIRLDNLPVGAKIIIKNAMLSEGNKATDWSPAPEDAQAEIEKAKASAAKAQTDANKANATLTDIANDNLLTPSEKKDIKREWDIIQGEKPTIIAQAQTYSIAYTAYETAYNNLNTYITPLLANLTINSTIVGTDFRAKFKAYYDAKIALLKAVTDKAKQLADTAQNTVDNLQIGGRNLVRNSIYSPTITGYALTKGRLLTPNTLNRINLTEYPIKAMGDYSISFWFKVEDCTTAFKIIPNINDCVAPAINVTSNLGWTFYSGTVLVWQYINQFGFIDLEGIPIGSNVTISDMVVVRGNKPLMSWIAAPEDVQVNIDKAQNTANSKNNPPHLDDIQPPIPSGGYIVGDLWYKKSLVDSSGNINADPKRNKYQLQYRWNGATWQQINWSASKSSIEQTESGITMLVDKTGIDNVGAGKTLYSMIQLTEQGISLEVNKLQIGGINLSKSFRSWRFTNTDAVFENDNSVLLSLKNATANGAIISPLIRRIGKYVASVNVKTTGQTTIYIDARGTILNNSHNQYVTSRAGSLIQFTLPSNFNERIIIYLNTDVEINNDWYIGIYGISATKNISLSLPQLELGEVANEWTSAIGDIPDYVGSKLAISSNKISLASTQIELIGETIADAIKAGSLIVESPLSSLKVLNDGTFYAKGSAGKMEDGTYQSLTIDSNERSFEIVSPQSMGALGGGSPLQTTLKMSGRDGRIEIRNNDGASYMSAGGVFANRAVNGIYGAGSDRMNSRASMVGLGLGSNTVSPRNPDDNAIIGVAGRAQNFNTSNPSPAYGGYFDNLKANGFHTSVRLIDREGEFNLRSTDTNIYITSLYANIALPTERWVGRTVYVYNLNSGTITIWCGSSKNYIYVNGVASNGSAIPKYGYYKFVYTDIKLREDAEGAWMAHKLN